MVGFNLPVETIVTSNKPKHKEEHNFVFQLSSMAGEHMLSSHAHNTLGTQCVYNILPFL